MCSNQKSLKVSAVESSSCLISDQKGEHLAKKSIRLGYSGLIIFAAYMVSIVTGLIFQFMVARALYKTYTISGVTHSEYDLWFNINDVVPYFTLMAGVLPFWIVRFVAKGKGEAAKTGIIANLTIATIATLVYLSVVSLITSMLDISTNYLPAYFLLSIQILELYSIAAFEACLQAKIPQTIGYGMLVQQVCKVALGYVLIIRFDQPLMGTVVTTIAAFALQTAYYVKLLAQELKQKIEWRYAKEWLKGSLATIYNFVGSQISAFIFIMLFSYGGKDARGIVGAATAVTAVITYSSFLAYALYPKLLAEKRLEDITTSVRMVMMFAIPMTVGAIALSNSFIALLKPNYSYAGLVLIVLAADAFITVISSILASVLYGFETVDDNARISLRQLAKSRMLMAFSLPYVYSAIALPTTYYVLTDYAFDQPFYAALYVSIISFSAHFAMLLMQYLIVRKMARIDMPWSHLAKYTLAAAVMGSTLYLIPHTTRLPMTLVETALGTIIYLALLMAIDKEARSLPSGIMREIKRRMNKTEMES
jgi:hypothetical protein